MKCLLASALLFSCALAFGQRPDEVLATSTGTTYTAQSLSAEARRIHETRDKIIADARSRFLNEMIAERLLDLESKAQNREPEDILDAERAKAAAPTAEQINAVYEANRGSIGGRTLEEVREQIVSYLKQEAGQKAVESFIQTLQAKYKAAPAKDVNAFGLRPADVLATIGTASITVKDFEDKYRIQLADLRAEIYEEVSSDLESAVFSTLIAQEAGARKIEAGDLIATEITDKLREFTDEERAALERELLKKLFAKYNVKILLKEPEAIVQNISVDDDPVIGTNGAPVTVVMFTDFQCPACSRTHPILKKVLSEYGDKVRLVVRDFPLQKLHPNAFMAAMAANAANSQGKFSEYIEILYRNQDALDQASLIKYAADLGLNVKKFELDLSDEKAAAEIRKDIADGTGYGATGTPTIFINGVKLRRLSGDGIRNAVDRALGR